MKRTKIKRNSGGWVYFRMWENEMKHVLHTGMKIGTGYRGIHGSSGWVPRWVRDAVLTFRDGGFAGITLTEYLIGMKP